jgi:hypothetical protein
LSAGAKADPAQVNGGCAFRSVSGCDAFSVVVVHAFENWGLEVVAVEGKYKYLVFRAGHVTLQT